MDEKIRCFKVLSLGPFKANLGDDDGFTEQLQEIKNWVDDCGYSYGSLMKKHKSEGKWSVLVDGNKLGYFVLTDMTYQDRIINNLIHDAEILCTKLVDGHNSVKEVNKGLKQLKNKYCKPEDFDKLQAANTKIDQIQIQMKDNMNDLVNNQGNLEV